MIRSEYIPMQGQTHAPRVWVLPPRPRPTDVPLPSDGRRVWTLSLSDDSPDGAAVTVSRLRDALRVTAAAPSGVRPTRVLSLGCNGITTMVSNVVKTPCRDAHSKYRRPKASPLFLPRGLSSSTPTRSTLAPAEPVTSPTNRMVLEPYLVVVHRSPTATGGLLRGGEMYACKEEAVVAFSHWLYIGSSESQ
jgi:hypothetical protein